MVEGTWRPDHESRVTSLISGPGKAPSEEMLNAQLDTLKQLHDEKAISDEVYEAEVAPLRARLEAQPPKRTNPAPRLDEFTGRMGTLNALYHAGTINTQTYLKYHTPVWNEWYHAMNILANGDFEEVDDIEAQPRFVDLTNCKARVQPWGDLGHSKVELDREVKHRGRQSVKFSSTRGPSCLLLVSKQILCRRNDSLKLHFWVKAKDLQRGYNARGSGVEFIKGDGIVEIIPSLRLHLPEGTYDGTLMQLRLNIFGNVPERWAEGCRVAIAFFGEGTLWVDDMVVVPTTRSTKP